MAKNTHNPPRTDADADAPDVPLREQDIERIAASLVPRLIDELARRGMLRIEFGRAVLAPHEAERQRECTEKPCMDPIPIGAAGESSSTSPAEEDAKKLVEHLRQRAKRSSSSEPSSARSRKRSKRKRSGAKPPSSGDSPSSTRSKPTAATAKR